MRGMERLSLIKAAGLVGFVDCSPGSGPAAPSYLGVERTIDNIRQSWSTPGAAPQPNRAGWDVLFDALLGDLKAYAKAESENDRLESLDRIYQISNVLGTVPWSPAATLREEIRQWLRPRLRVASADEATERHGHGPARHQRSKCSGQPVRGGSTLRRKSWEVLCATTTRLIPSPDARPLCTAFTSR